MTYLLPFSGHLQPEEGMQFISPDVQCCAENAESTGDKLRQRRCLRIRTVLELFLQEQKEKPCHL